MAHHIRLDDWCCQQKEHVFLGRAKEKIEHLSFSSKRAAQHSVHSTGGSRRVIRQFAWLEVGSVKVALSRPAHQRVTHTVRLKELEES